MDPNEHPMVHHMDPFPPPPAPLLLPINLQGLMDLFLPFQGNPHHAPIIERRLEDPNYAPQVERRLEDPNGAPIIEGRQEEADIVELQVNPQPTNHEIQAMGQQQRIHQLENELQAQAFQAHLAGQSRLTEKASFDYTMQVLEHNLQRTEHDLRTSSEYIQSLHASLAAQNEHIEGLEKNCVILDTLMDVKSKTILRLEAEVRKLKRLSKKMAQTSPKNARKSLKKAKNKKNEVQKMALEANKSIATEDITIKKVNKIKKIKKIKKKKIPKTKKPQEFDAKCLKNPTGKMKNKKKTKKIKKTEGKKKKVQNKK